MSELKLPAYIIFNHGNRNRNRDIMVNSTTDKNTHKRRIWLKRYLALTGTWLLGRTPSASAATKTATTVRAAEGPFYPTETMRPGDVDNDLVKVEGQVREAGGEIVVLTGRVLDSNGKPQANHRIEIWQCDVNGKYLHTGDKSKITYDQGFQGFGHDMTNDNGEYRFRTIKPTRYPGRTPHIHVKVCKDEKELLTTQLYVAENPENKDDSLFNRMSSEEADAVSMKFVNQSGSVEAQLNIIV